MGLIRSHRIGLYLYLYLDLDLLWIGWVQLMRCCNLAPCASGLTDPLSNCCPTGSPFYCRPRTCALLGSCVQHTLLRREKHVGRGRSVNEHLHFRKTSLGANMLGTFTRGTPACIPSTMCRIIPSCDAMADCSTSCNTTYISNLNKNVVKTELLRSIRQRNGMQCNC